MIPKRYRNTGRPPRDNTIPLGIEWANGRTATRTYFAHQLKWELRGQDFDIAYYWRTDGQGEKEE